MGKNNYKNQVRLLLEILPFVHKETCFAIKGGAAINLFVRDFPRLSVEPLLMIFLPVVYGVTLAECFITKNNYSTCVFDVTAMTLWLTSLNLVYLSLFALAEWTEGKK